MSEGYTKFFSDLVDSSIWDEPPEVCKVWVTLLVLCNSDGFVRGSVGWLAGKARVSRETCEIALRKFQSPDSKSRTPDNDGKRIEQLDDGWLVLNYLAFRDRLSTNPKAIATRIRVQKHRQRYEALRNANSVTSSQSVSVSVHSLSQSCKEGGIGGTETRKEFPTKPVEPNNKPNQFANLRDSLCSMYRREHVDPWSYEEETYLVSVGRRSCCMSELKELMAYRESNGKFFPRSILKLLTDWTVVLDRARNTVTEPEQKTLIERQLEKACRDALKPI